MKKVKIALVIILPLVLICCILGVFLKKEKILKEIKNEEVSLGEVSDEMYFGEILEGVLCSAPLPKELYQHGLDLVEDNQVVFVYRYSNYAWGNRDELLIVDKNNRCKKINLLEGDLINKEWFGEEDSRFLEYLDTYMADTQYPYCNYEANFSEQELLSVINMMDITLNKPEPVALDSSDFAFYYVNGVENNRKIHLMIEKGSINHMPKTNKKQINKICDKLQEIYERAD